MENHSKRLPPRFILTCQRSASGMEAKRSRAGRFNTSEPSAGRLESSDLRESQSSTGRPDLRRPDSHRPSAGRRVRTKRSLVAVFGFSLCILLAPGLDLQTHGFWAQGHHAIAVLAFEMLDPKNKTNSSNCSSIIRGSSKISRSLIPFKETRGRFIAGGSEWPASGRT